MVAATITYNLVEAAIALTAGTVADSTALVGFGLDSIIEVASALAVAWQFSARDHEARERVALRIVAVSFLALAAYVAVESIRVFFGATAQALRTSHRSQPGVAGRPAPLSLMTTVRPASMNPRRSPSALACPCIEASLRDPAGAVQGPMVQARSGGRGESGMAMTLSGVTSESSGSAGTGSAASGS